MKTIILFFLLFCCFEAKSLPFEDGFTYTVIDSTTLQYNYWDVSCLNNDECLFLKRKGLNGAIIYKTLDGGKTTRIIYADTTTMKDGKNDYIPDYFARNIYYFKSGVVIVVGYFGVFLKSTDFGETWKKYKSEYYMDFLDVEVVNENLAFIVTDKIPNWDDEVYISTDGCESWKLFPVPDSIRSTISPLTIKAQTNGDLLVGYFSKKDLRNWYMFRTDFEGNNWELLNTPPNTYEITHMSDNEWVSRGNTLDSNVKHEFVVVHKTTDAGKTWDLKFKSELPFKTSRISIFSESLNTGYILGPNNMILKTKDKGNSWYFIRDSLPYLGFTSSITGACMPSDDVLYYTTTQFGRIVKYSADPASVNEPQAITSKLYPNPVHSNNSFSADYEISKSGFIRQYICDLGGKEISELYKGQIESGQYSSTYNLPESLLSGTYWFVTEMNGICHVKMLNVVK
jgi:photosystem II stability/assembly factor-like uncharacterized protein